MPEGVRVVRKPDWRASLYDLLKAYAGQRIAAVDRTFRIEPPKVYAIEDARARLERILGRIPDWVDLNSLAPAREIDAPPASTLASAFMAALEFAKDGRLFMRQLAPFGPVYVRRRGDGEILAGNGSSAL
jgi:segregation and condensation protein A